MNDIFSKFLNYDINNINYNKKIKFIMKIILIIIKTNIFIIQIIIFLILIIIKIIIFINQNNNIFNIKSSYPYKFEHCYT
jgi:hypothetical protein